MSDVATFMSNKQQIRMQRKVAAYPPFLGGAADGGAEGTQQWLATSLPSEDDEGMGGNASPGPGGMSSSHALAVEARAIGRERVAMKKKHGVKANILLPPTDDSAATSPPSETASAAVDSPSDCNPDDQHNLSEAEAGEAAMLSFRGDWSEHPVRRACMQVGLQPWHRLDNGICCVILVRPRLDNIGITCTVFPHLSLDFPSLSPLKSPPPLFRPHMALHPFSPSHMHGNRSIPRIPSQKQVLGTTTPLAAQNPILNEKKSYKQCRLRRGCHTSRAFERGFGPSGRLLACVPSSKRRGTPLSWPL